MNVHIVGLSDTSSSESEGASSSPRHVSSSITTNAGGALSSTSTTAPAVASAPPKLTKSLSLALHPDARHDVHHQHHSSDDSEESDTDSSRLSHTSHMSTSSDEFFDAAELVDAHRVRTAHEFGFDPDDLLRMWPAPAISHRPKPRPRPLHDLTSRQQLAWLASATVAVLGTIAFLVWTGAIELIV